MARFFFNLRRGNELILDEDGAPFPDAEAAYLEAFAAARDLWSAALLRREDPTVYCFEVMDEKNRHLFSLPFSEVLDAARKGKKRIMPSEIKALLERNRVLRDGLIAQIEHTRGTLEHTHHLLRLLRKYE